MKFKLTIKKKVDTINFSDELNVATAGENGVFEAQAINFAKTQSNAFIREYLISNGFRIRTQKEWVKNIKTKNFEKSVMVQNGTKPETYIFTLSQC